MRGRLGRGLFRSSIWVMVVSATLTGLLVGIWLGALVSPVKGPLEEWHSIRDMRLQGEPISWVRASYEIIISFMVGLMVFQFALFPVVLATAFMWHKLR